MAKEVIKCDGDCFECPYPDVPSQCLNGPRREYTALQKQRRHDEYMRNRTKKLAYARDYKAKRKHELSAVQAEIRKARKAKGLSAAALAEQIGVCRGTLTGWERGEAPAHWDSLCAVLPELTAFRPKERGGLT